ncbi:putative c-24 sterol reductase protein [Neofusicoccum parvum UCRNP2]|uniref:Delta(24(24(1)))-sterol reductase n=1 Tax=Botryosphaeria parva (strain UCR-NP2) TaxID=1287680 RepID=R1E8J3_BOTPV|nr:putative c-24 sterol reductase protein [Neofusicoccum parvum UCRNP2]
MSANPPGAIVASKSTNTAAQLSPQTQTGPSAAGDSYGQRRTGGSGSFGAGAASRAYPSPRHNQSSKKKHKGAKRPGLADEDAIAESVAMRSTSSRKGQTSITHLMNFSLPPRPQNHYHSHGHGRSYRRNPPWGPGSGYHAADKARYVHANYRFIVDPREDYEKQSADADVHLDWNNVLQILASAQSQSASCPICLGTPVAPRMARCGHIFCLPCLIRFMHADAETKLPEKKARSKKCPICEDNIYMSDTRPVRFYIGQEGEPPREGADVVLRLVMRSSGSMLALPRDGADALPKGEDVPWYIAAEVMDYARIMKGSENYMMEQFEGDVQEIERQAREDELMFGEDNVEWTRKAVKMINESKEKVKGIGNPPSATTKPPDSKSKKSTPAMEEPSLGVQEVPTSDLSLDQTPPEDPSSVSTDAPVQIEQPGTSGDAQPSGTSNLSKSLAEFRSRQQHDNQTPSEYYFYQALLHYYLSPLDIRILKAAFGNFASFPSTILPRVERVSTGHVVDDDLRKRTKYLAHLPYGCEVGFLECDWTDTVAPEILEKFKSEIERRRKRNHEKEAKEEKARQKAEKEEDQKAPALLASTHDHDVPADDGWLQGWEKDLLREEDSMVAQVQAMSLGNGESSAGGGAGGGGGGGKKKKKKITLMSTNLAMRPRFVETPGRRRTTRKSTFQSFDGDSSENSTPAPVAAPVQLQEPLSNGNGDKFTNGHANGNGHAANGHGKGEKLAKATVDPTMAEATPHFEFGGSWGTGAMMIGFPMLMYYMWLGATFYDGKPPTPAEGQSLGEFFRHMFQMCYEHAFPHARAWTIYWVFMAIQIVFYLYMPGVYAKGQALPHLGGKQLDYYCSAVWSWYTSIVLGLTLHYTGIFKLYTLIDEFGSLMSVAILSGFLMSFYFYISAHIRGATVRMTGYPVYDFFMGSELNPRLFGWLDWKMFFEVRMPWFILYFLTLGTAARQYENYGYVSGEVMFLVMAHWLYANACSKGEQLIVTTWDMYFEKLGFMLTFWNLAGVPLSYCHCTLYLANHDPSEYAKPRWVLALMFPAYLFVYWVWDTANSQKNHFRHQERGSDYDRKTFPVLPWRVVKNPRTIPTNTGKDLLADGWYGLARKIHYSCDLYFALNWGFITGFSSPFPWFYPFFFSCMIVHRALRDIQRCRQQYGEAWKEYERQVPYLFIPYVI